MPEDITARIFWSDQPRHDLPVGWWVSVRDLHRAGIEVQFPLHFTDLFAEDQALVERARREISELRDGYRVLRYIVDRNQPVLDDRTWEKVASQSRHTQVNVEEEGSMPPVIQLPPKNNAGEQTLITCGVPVVIIGANGSGKSRLGAWIESNSPHAFVHRIAAQRMLVVPEHVDPRHIDKAEAVLFYGDEHRSNKMQSRWHGRPTTQPLNDYQQLISALFARKAKRDSDYVENTRRVGYHPIPEAPTEALVRIWQELLPHRTLTLENGSIFVLPPGASANERYKGGEMSDGERVIFYLIGQSLCAPPGSVIMIDEPEIHLHKGIAARLWNTLERNRTDCGFVYLTHDLDFAASREGATKLWVKDYSGRTGWDWDFAQTVADVPESVVLNILGSRKQVMFVEGNHGSHDVHLLSLAYPDRFVMPVGGCETVIRFTRAIRESGTLHHLDALGMIDRDYRSDADVRSLNGLGIFAPMVAEIENLFFIEPMVRAIALHQHLVQDDVWNGVKAFLFELMASDRETQVTNWTVFQVENRLKGMPKSGKGVVEMRRAIDQIPSSIPVEDLYRTNEALYDEIVAMQDHERALAVFNNKGFAAQAARRFLGLEWKSYVRIAFGLLGNPANATLLGAVKSKLPTLP